MVLSLNTPLSAAAGVANTTLAPSAIASALTIASPLRLARELVLGTSPVNGGGKRKARVHFPPPLAGRAIAYEMNDVHAPNLTSPLWGGRPSERVRAKKAGWGAKCMSAPPACVLAGSRTLPPPGSPLRWRASGSPTLYLESGLRG